MAIVYKCSHCDNLVGQLDHHTVDTQALGWNNLSSEDRKQMIQYQNNGDIQIKTICEDCQESLDRNPHYHELDFFIQ
ncbi:anti-sigma-F factor Fin family protein [Aquibacillus koreensis]|uniref:Anti-sigma-F factor Fin family protein n=1 Tax=Aquibacillus koreensis TaxID=279446 RepID=A0A9X3WS76_9BACI|nr:anti-sigma-F factor Fin family protein [Aquibacillus koreensis]MCT2534312.1 anti-sigma-F factor Fin family protein [Aquibacillus koreensis]MDC3422389.1 anti-sigma-F factor Fin family protein [Aquibacillus koreensis]